MNQPHGKWRGEKTSREASAVVCPACSAAARRADAHFCATCGRGLHESLYAPADSLLASYHQQHSRPAMLIEQELSGLGEARAAYSSQLTEAPPRNMMTFGAFLCAIAALVPFAGIVFAPCVIVLGALGLRNARRASYYRGERRAIYSMVLGVVIFSAQLLFVYWFLLFGMR
jgi:hypothetical protein